MTASPTDNLVAKGGWGEVRYAIDARGRMPAKAFVEGLDDDDAAKVAALFQRIAASGKVTNPERFRKERGEIFAFKSFQIRISCFRRGNTWYLASGFIKKEDRWRTSELDKADRIRKEHLNRK